FSRQFFSEKFSSEGIDAEYLNFELPEIDDFTKVFEGRDICGLNVTIPYKQDVIPFLSELSEDAREIGAVNVIKPIHVHSGNNKDNQSVILM
ncbi:MAG: shikimate dehydrogenase, partial [Prevotellaceae bacterium]|nr:shikimate dehydrogenase [Prevotellaceae bacterium]